MAEIRNFLDLIESGATDGRSMRKPIADALNEINENGGNAQTLGGHDEYYFGKASDLEKKQDKLGFDAYPVKDSTKMVYSGRLYLILNEIRQALDTINGDPINGDDGKSDA